MKVLGLIGGTSYISTIQYYQLLNKRVNEQLGGMQFANCLIHSFNYAEIIRLINDNRWDELLDMVSAASQNLERCGADAILLCANTLHVIADRLEESLQLPIIHIGETAYTIKKNPLITNVGLIGTIPTMEHNFIKGVLKNDGIQVSIPNQDDRQFIHRAIFSELGKGIFNEGTKNNFLEIMQRPALKHVDAWILGCTELSLVLQASDLNVPLFDTTDIHVAAAVRFALD